MPIFLVLSYFKVVNSVMKNDFGLSGSEANKVSGKRGY